MLGLNLNIWHKHTSSQAYIVREIGTLETLWRDLHTSGGTKTIPAQNEDTIFKKSTPIHYRWKCDMFWEIILNKLITK